MVFHNGILAALSPEDRGRLTPDLRPLRLEVRQFLERPALDIEQVVFPESGIVSVLSESAGRKIEAGLIGFEGMTGLSVVLGDRRSPMETVVQVAGAGRAIGADVLKAHMRASPGLVAVFLRFANAFTTQIAQTALANGRANIEVRLARWLLMASDRLESHELPLTHELLSVILGVRRPGVTDALHKLEGDLVIRARRGVVTIRHRDGLTAAAAGSYGVPEAEYRRLFGDVLESGGAEPASIASAHLAFRALGRGVEPASAPALLIPH